MNKDITENSYVPPPVLGLPFTNMGQSNPTMEKWLQPF